MSENFKFIGRKYTEKEKEQANGALVRFSKESSCFIDGESEKTEEEIKMIETINLIIKTELESLGIKKYNPIPVNKIHILPKNIFLKKFNNSKEKAFFYSVYNSIYLKKETKDTKALLFSTLLHECIHHASTAKFYVDKKRGIYDARVGYRIQSIWKDSKNISRLKGFNEVMVDCMVYQVLIKNIDLLEKSFGITKEDIEGSIYSYMNYASILASILKKISIDRNLSTKEIFDNFKSGLFNNNLLVLKDIEKSFGKGSLEIISLLEGLKKEKHNFKLEKMIKKFFNEQDETKRQIIRSKILTFFNQIQKSISD